MKDRITSILFAWLGHKDLESSAAAHTNAGDLGPIADAVRVREPSRVVILSAQEPSKAQRYHQWLRQLGTLTDIHIRQTHLLDPWDFAGIYRESGAAIEEQQPKTGKPPAMTFHLSPGTGAMSASWIILSKTRFPAELIQSSQQDTLTKRFPIRTVNLPFNLSIELIGDLLRQPGEELVRLSQSLPPANPEFAKIVHKSRVMEEVVLKARQWALVDAVPILILGESGTGKELLARAIHAGSPRAAKPFKAINCGAIPAALIESELFGHVKGAFTGANTDRPGIFEAAHGGTVFLDEVGELPQDAQVRLLRVLQEREVTKVGDIREIPVDVRVIAATNRDLFQDVVDGRFRDDLFYRLAVAIMKVPPLRERGEDIDLLIDHLVAQNSPDATPVKITPSARGRLREHDWPGNVRELHSTLIRAAPPWAAKTPVTAEAVDEAILRFPTTSDNLLDRPLGNGFSLPALLDEVRRHYLERALRSSRGNQTTAAKSLGITRQTFGNWLNGRHATHLAERQQK